MRSKLIIAVSIWVLVKLYIIIENWINKRKMVINRERYTKYVKNELTVEENKKIVKNRQTVIKLFREANVKDYKIPYTELADYNLVATGTTSLFANYPTCNRKYIVRQMLDAFYEAEGVFENRIKEQLNPLNWIREIIFLPKIILNQCLGFNIKTIIIKIIQLLYWILGIIITIFSTEIKTFIITLFRGN